MIAFLENLSHKEGKGRIMASSELKKLVEEEQLAEQEIDAAEKVVDTVNTALGISKNGDSNPRYRDKIDALFNDPQAHEVAELLDGLENDVQDVVEFIRQLLERGREFEEKHPEMVMVIKKFLVAHHELRELKHMMQVGSAKKTV